MTVHHTPAPARSDAAPTTSGPAAPAGPSAGRWGPYRRHGLTLAAGAGAWAVALAVLGTHGSERDVAIEQGVGFLFQVGLLCLLRVLWLTRALGEGRVARAVLRVESLVVVLAMASTLGAASRVEDLDGLGWILLDTCWPLSMAGMFLIGIRIAVAGRWSGLSRWWPMVAESWAVVTIPSMIVFGPGAVRVVGSLHMLLGYGVLGLIVARKQR